MSIQKAGGLAGLICALTYVFGFVGLVTVLRDLGYGTNAIDGQAVVAFIQDRPSFLIIWNSVIYILNALALACLVAVLHTNLRQARPELATVALILGVIWAALVLGAGMIANVAIERAADLASTDIAKAAQLWETLHAVELGLGGGNEIAGGAWIGIVSLAGLLGRSLGKFSLGLGVLTSLGGMATLVPVLGDTAGAVFGLGAIGWFISVGVDLLMGAGAQGLPSARVQND